MFTIFSERRFSREEEQLIKDNNWYVTNNPSLCDYYLTDERKRRTTIIRKQREAVLVNPLQSIISSLEDLQHVSIIINDFVTDDHIFEKTIDWQEKAYKFFWAILYFLMTLI